MAHRLPDPLQSPLYDTPMKTTLLTTIGALVLCVDAFAQGPGTSYCTSTVNSSGFAATMSGSGSASIMANDLTLIATNVPQIPGIGIFIASPGAAQIPIWDGFLCVAPQGLQRINQITTPVGGVVTQLIDYTGASTGTVPLNVFAGFSFFYSYWYRDAAAGNTGANLTDGYDVVHTP